jgi:rifampicin phosphotransferase
VADLSRGHFVTGRSFVLGIAVALAIGCAGVGPSIVTANSDGDTANSIADLQTWKQLAAHDETSVFADTSSVKVIVDRDNQQVYFLQSRRWPLHYDFAEKFLLGSIGGEQGWQFNQREYHDDDRRFVLGTLLHFAAHDMWTFELYAGDTLSAAATLAAIDTIRHRVFFANQLMYRPMSPAHRLSGAGFAGRIPIATDKDLFGNVQYQAIETGEVMGRVRVIDALLADTIGHAKQMEALTVDDIAVIDEPPLEIQPVAAIVSAQLLAPLGHIAILAHSRATPTAAVLDTAKLNALRTFRDQWVKLSVTGSEMRVVALSDAAAATASATRRSRRDKILLPLRLSPDNPGMLPLVAIATDDLEHFGAKTVQLAKVAKLGAPTPRAFGVSFAAYLDFLHSAGLDTRIEKMLASPRFKSDPIVRRQQLHDLRDAMLTSQVPPRISVVVAAQIAVKLGGSRSIRLRSSTNAEDLAGFSGAGLYQSVRVPAGNYAELEQGLRRVWASVWSFEAFEERAHFGIEQNRVAMAILVQESIDTDEVSGVIVTGNPFFEGRPAVFINAAPRGASVTGAGGNQVPEQILQYTFESMAGTERISRSSQSTDRDLLSDEEVNRLSAVAQTLHKGFVGSDVGSAEALDIEFLVTRGAQKDAKRDIVIVQARPYTMRWAQKRQEKKR